MRIKKHLGQNFLRSRAPARVLVDAVKINHGDVVVEVGPGKGIITEILLGKAKKVVAVEKDGELVEYLQEKFSKEIESGEFTLVHGDILSFNPKYYSLATNGYSLVGAIPYYITSRFLKTFLSMEQQPKTVALIIQKEVARRIASKNNKESLLSLSVKVYGAPRYVRTIKAENFNPKPGVDSAVLVIEKISKNFFKDIPEESFFTLIKTGFGCKRKKLTTNLRKGFSKTKLEKSFQKLNISLNIRAEDVALEQWRKLYILLSIK